MLGLRESSPCGGLLPLGWRWCLPSILLQIFLFCSTTSKFYFDIITTLQSRQSATSYLPSFFLPTHHHHHHHYLLLDGAAWSGALNAERTLRDRRRIVSVESPFLSFSSPIYLFIPLYLPLSFLYPHLSPCDLDSSGLNGYPSESYPHFYPLSQIPTSRVPLTHHHPVHNARLLHSTTQSVVIVASFGVALPSFSQLRSNRQFYRAACSLENREARHFRHESQPLTHQ